MNHNDEEVELPAIVLTIGGGIIMLGFSFGVAYIVTHWL